MSWWVILCAGLCTYLLRGSFVLFFKGSADPRFERALRYVPVAVLPALAFSAVMGKGDVILWPRITAALVAALLAWRTKGLGLAMLGGMVVLWIGNYWAT